MTKSTTPAQYAPLTHVRQVYDQTVPKHDYAAIGQAGFGQWQAELRAKVATLLGGFNWPRGDLAPQVLANVEKDGYLQQKIEITSEPGVRLPFYVLTPQTGQAPYPAVIALHGHGSGVQEVIGEPQDEQVAAHIRNCNHDYGRQLAQQGFLVLAPEQRAFGERREMEDVAQSPGQSSCRQASMNALMLGRTMVGMRVWDVMRVIDYAEQYAGQTGLANLETLACVGLSGGGTVTTFATAMDDRITTAVISGYFCTWQWSIMAMRHCEDNYIPGILQHAEMADVGALIAPRPLLIEAGTEDPIFPLPGVHDAHEKLAKVYALLDAPERLALDVFAGEHQWHGTLAADWLRRWL